MKMTPLRTARSREERARVGEEVEVGYATLEVEVGEPLHREQVWRQRAAPAHQGGTAPQRLIRLVALLLLLLPLLAAAVDRATPRAQLQPEGKEAQLRLQPDDG